MKSLHDSLQSQYDAFANGNNTDESLSKAFEKKQNKLDDELSEWMESVDYTPVLTTRPPHSHEAIQKKENNVPVKTHPSSGNNANVNVPVYVPGYKRALHLNALHVVFAVSLVTILVLPWTFWPTQPQSSPKAPTKLQTADMTKPTVPTVKTADMTKPTVPTVKTADMTKPAVPIVVTDSTPQVALATDHVLDKSALDKVKRLNAVLATNPAAAGNMDAHLNPKSVADKMLEILPPIGRIRSEPGLQGKVVARLQSGTHVFELGRQGDWLRVRLLNHSEGWAYKTIVVSTSSTKLQ